MVRTECDDAAFQLHYRKVHTQKFLFDLKDKNYKKAKMKGRLGWMKNSLEQQEATTYCVKIKYFDF